MKLSLNSKLLFIGDSITDSGRNPSGEVCSWEPNLGLGNGYVSMIHSWINAAHPESAIRFLNRGTSGNTVRDLAGRWDTDVLAEKPQTLCIMIGINDVWRQFDCPLRPELGVRPEEYRATLHSLVAAAKTCVSDIHIATHISSSLTATTPCGSGWTSMAASFVKSLRRPKLLSSTRRLHLIGYWLTTIR